KSWPCIFTCSKTSAIQISDSPRNPANNIITFSQLISQYIFATRSVNDRAFLAHIPTLVTVDISIPLQASLAFKRLSELIKLPSITSILLLMASHLELSNAATHTFYTNS